MKEKLKKLLFKLTKFDKLTEYLRNHDSLTGYPNRNQLIKVFNDANEKNPEKEKAILIANIDRLHSINDLYGREFGDSVIIKLTERLEEVFKEQAFIFKEENFYLYFNGISNEELDKLCTSVLEVINRPLKVGNETLRVTVSVGASHYPSTGKEIITLLQQAEIAMDKVKNDNKGTYEIILEKDIERIERKRILEFDLQNAISKEELYLRFQPEVSMKTGEIKGAEALLRWKHPIFGNISPVEFIPIAEETALINDIGKWVIEEAVKEANSWHKKGLKINIAVNVSYIQLKDKNLFDYILSILKKVNFDPRYLIIEITESVMKDIENVKMISKDLKKEKIKMAIDDFGTGYSSLGVLGTMYMDMIKIDRTFIENLPEDKKSAQIVKMIIQMGENLGSSVIAEGVENRKQIEFLLENNCHYAQGYYFSRPVSSAEILEYKNK